MRRALHYVFKTADREATVRLYKQWGMKVLRHEEFTEGCQATCNGPYAGHWSKTMIGYGPEHSHFVIELTYNYGVFDYKLGNDFQYFTLNRQGISGEKRDPDGHRFRFRDDASSANTSGGFKSFRSQHQEFLYDPFKSVAIGVSNLQRSVGYWRDLIGMRLVDEASDSVTLTFDESQCHLVLRSCEKIDRGTGFGRIAFACPSDQLPTIERQMLDAKQTILNRLISLDTPGKATVQVVILADPDGHEICFVGEEGFSELSAVDPNADAAFMEAVAKDRSREYTGLFPPK